MANINGLTQKRTTLTANSETIIDFQNGIQKISLMADDGTVYFKIDETISDTSDLNSNYIKPGCSVDTYKIRPFKTLHVLSSTATSIQWLTC